MERIPADFVAKMSHDLKTPVGNAMMYAELMAEDIRTLLEEHPELGDHLLPLEHYCKNIHLSSSKLINAIQSWGYSFQIEDNVFQIDETAVNLKDMLEGAIKANQLFIKGKSLQVSFDYASATEVYHTDQELIKLVFDNLLTLFITMGRNGAAIHVDVTDDENGILFRFLAPDAAFHPKLVDVFSSDIRIRDRMAPEQGVLKPGGYNLIFVNLALRYIGGATGVDDEETRPRSFWFRLPLT
ncbi:hypothetical protein QA596_01430 [Balneolales bacterium ANBcel1]|nr:hypothetical protein [Balneolales bacterium ANBcel1]